MKGWNMKDPVGIPEGFTEVDYYAPFSMSHGPTYERVIDENIIERAFRAEHKHLNGANMIHGGMLMAFGDAAMARTVRHVTGKRCVTIKMNSEFLSPAKLGDWVVARCEVVRDSKSVVFVRGEMKTRGHVVFVMDGIFHYAKHLPVKHG
jgi:uncharacterized protein (TIGR00369 family)